MLRNLGPVPGTKDKEAGPCIDATVVQPHPNLINPVLFQPSDLKCMNPRMEDGSPADQTEAGEIMAMSSALHLSDVFDFPYSL